VSDRILRGALGALLLIGTLASCTEQVTGSLGCPDLCTDESAVLRDTTLLATIVIDTTFGGFPRLGEDHDITLWNNLDTADVRLVTRFDSLSPTYLLAGVDSLVRRVDSAQLIFLIDTLTSRPTLPFTIDAFDVDTTTTDDTVLNSVIPLFRANRLIGSQTYSAADLKADTVRLTLDNAALFAKVRDTLPLRVGLRVRGAGSSHIRVLGNSFIPRLRMRVSADTSVLPDTAFPRSKTPLDADVSVQNALAFYPVVVAGALPLPPTGRFAVGGLAGARTYIRFDIPSILIDSVQVIRASLVLTQARARSTAAVADSITVFTQPVLAAPSVTDIYTAATFIGDAHTYGIDSVRFAPRDSGLKNIELVNLFRFWKAIGSANTSRSVVLRAPEEGVAPGEAEFFSMEGPVAQRPRLRLTYVPRRGFGIP
jgi:hypothetical protein